MGKLVFFSAMVLIAGMVYFSVFQNTKAAQINMVFNEKKTFYGVVIDEPQPSEKFTRVSIEAQPPLKGNMVMLLPPEAAIEYGDLIRIEGKILPPLVPGDMPLTYFPRVQIESHGHASTIREWLIDIKVHVLKIFLSVLSRDEAGLLGGIAFGSKVDLSAGLKEALGRSGTTHLVAVSGYNITIVLYAIERMLRQFLARRIMLIVAAIAVVLFVCMTGFQASAIRAAIMGCIAIGAGEMGGASYMDTGNVLVIGAASMALFDPTLPVRDIGFQLSFLSLAGILYLEAPLRNLFHMQRHQELGIKADAVTTAAAQLGVLPIVSAAFGGFSLTAIMANIMVLGTVPITMGLGFALAVSGSLSRFLAFGPAQAVHILLAYQIMVIKFWSAWTVPISIPGIWFVSALYYGGLIWFTKKYTPQRSWTITKT